MLFSVVLLAGLGHTKSAQAQDEKRAVLDISHQASKSAVSAAVCRDGNAAGYPCSSIDLVSHLPLSDLGAGPGIGLNDAWGWTDPETNQRWALMGREDGVAFVEITDPASPRYAGELPMPSTAQSNVWRDIKVDGYFAFVVADGSGSRRGLHGMQVFDLRKLRDAVGSPLSFEADAHYTQFQIAHNIVVNEETDRAYAVGARLDQRSCNGGLHIIDISDPLTPLFAGCFADVGTGRGGGGYVHDAQCVVYRGPDVTYRGREICVGSNETAISIADVTNADAPVAISRGTYPNASYVHQGWFTEDQRYFIQNDELDERVFDTRTHTYIWDVGDLDDPVLLRDFASSAVSTDHNLYVRGDFVYQANYSSGLRVMDVSNPSDPFVTGFFDTRPDDSAVNFNGAWTAWPYPDSDLVIISSRGEGMFVVRPSNFMGMRFTSIEAESNGQSVQLAWSLNRVSHVDRFEVIQLEEAGPRLAATLTAVSGQHDLSTILETGEGVFRFQVTAVGFSGERLESEEVVVHVLEGAYLVDTPWPNPATALVRSQVIVSTSQMVRVMVHDALGRERIEVFDGRLSPEEALPLRIRANGLGPGTYYIRVTGERFTRTLPIVVTR